MDVTMVGLQNAGKTSLLRVLSVCVFQAPPPALLNNCVCIRLPRFWNGEGRRRGTRDQHRSASPPPPLQSALLATLFQLLSVFRSFHKVKSLTSSSSIVGR